MKRSPKSDNHPIPLALPKQIMRSPMPSSHRLSLCCFLITPCLVLATAKNATAEDKPAKGESGKLTLSWGKIKEPVGGSTFSAKGRDFVTIHGAHLPGKQVRVRYLEAFCRANS